MVTVVGRCKRETEEKTVRRVVELARGKYHDFNDHHLTETLKKQEKISCAERRSTNFCVPTGSAPPRSAAGSNT